jgi:small GTP-binding protein
VFNGSGGVGKTCFLMRLLNGAYPDDYIPTVFENYAATFRHTTLPDCVFELGFWDIMGARDGNLDWERRVRPLTYQGTDVMFIVVDCSSRKSLVAAEELWLPQSLLHVPDARVVLLVLKIDLRDDDKVVQELAKRNETMISSEEAEEWARKHNCAAVLQCSAKRGDGMATFLATISELMLTKPAVKPVSRLKTLFRSLFGAKPAAAPVDPNPSFTLTSL